MRRVPVLFLDDVAPALAATAIRRCVISRKQQKRVLNASKVGTSTCWQAATKVGSWGQAKGVGEEGYDLSILQGNKGEAAVASYLGLDREVDSTATPEHYDLLLPDGKTIEVKTSGKRYDSFLYRAQQWSDRRRKYEYMYHLNDKAVKGLLADYYVFATTDTSSTNWEVDIQGWISKEEILADHSTLHPPKTRRGPSSASPAWLNYEIPADSLKDIELFRDREMHLGIIQQDQD